MNPYGLLWVFIGQWVVMGPLELLLVFMRPHVSLWVRVGPNASLSGPIRIHIEA